MMPLSCVTRNTLNERNKQQYGDCLQEFQELTLEDVIKPKRRLSKIILPSISHDTKENIHTQSPSKTNTSTPTTPLSQQAKESFVVINPACLGEAGWSYRDLQLLCMKLGLGGKGSREQLINKLHTWNREHPEEQLRNVLDTDKPPSKFTLLDLNITEKTTTKDIAPHLTPLRCRPPRAVDGTPVGILSVKSPFTPSHQKRLSFSLFNGVKIIPPREQRSNADQSSSEDEEDDDDDDVIQFNN
jgi:hypothetical protein